jgi:hypothetical protein
MGYQSKVYREQGGKKLVVLATGEIEVRSGGTLDMQSGSTITEAGTVTQSGTRNVTGTLNITTGGLTLASGGYIKDSWITATADTTLTAAKSGQTYKVNVADLRFDLPAATTAGDGVFYRFVLATGGLSSATAGAGLKIRPASGDFITGIGLNSTDGQKLDLSATSDREGDCVCIRCDGAGGWYITEAEGTWVKSTAT